MNWEFEKDKEMYVGTSYSSFQRLNEKDFFIMSICIASDSRIITLGKSYVVVEIDEWGYIQSFPATLIEVNNQDEWVFLHFHTRSNDRHFTINLVEDYFNVDARWQILDLDYFREEIEDMEIKDFCNKDSLTC